MVVYGPPVGQVQELKISQIMVESMFKAAMGDIERFNRKFMILSGFEVAGYSDTIPATLSASLSAQARDKGYVQKIWVIAQFVW